MAPEAAVPTMGNKLDGCSGVSSLHEAGKGCDLDVTRKGCDRIFSDAGCCTANGGTTAGSTGIVCARSLNCRYPQEPRAVTSQEVNVEGLDFDVGSPIKPHAVLASPLQESTKGNVPDGTAKRSLFADCSTDSCRNHRRQGSGGCENVRPSLRSDLNVVGRDPVVKSSVEGLSSGGDTVPNAAQPGTDMFGASHNESGRKDWHGAGILTWPDGRRYVGQFSEGLFHGEAIMDWPDGRRYVGQYRNNKKHGDGEFVWPDGRRYSGQWRIGLRHGRGDYKNSKGEQRVGIWNQDRPVCWEAAPDEAEEDIQVEPLQKSYDVENLQKSFVNKFTDDKASDSVDWPPARLKGQHTRNSSVLGGA